eukprot:TRINITY_DN2636_c2_g1_i1.p1 TRINITY_DN2636_c2_g1~~TRINITY_DN2636_c2_g1_i1.p1  ORF type:complete len:377 (+),score=61.25 TRINITY_DN2636_c2_g1_i1:202-1332(+)
MPKKMPKKKKSVSNKEIAFNEINRDTKNQKIQKSFRNNIFYGMGLIGLTSIELFVVVTVAHVFMYTLLKKEFEIFEELFTNHSTIASIIYTSLTFMIIYIYLFIRFNGSLFPNKKKPNLVTEPFYIKWENKFKLDKIFMIVVISQLIEITLVMLYEYNKVSELSFRSNLKILFDDPITKMIQEQTNEISSNSTSVLSQLDSLSIVDIVYEINWGIALRLFILTPIFEELSYRWLIPQRFFIQCRSYVKNDWFVFVILSNFWFGFSHFLNIANPNFSPFYVFLQIVQGIVIGTFYSTYSLSNSSILSSMVLHIINNLFAMFSPTTFDGIDAFVIIQMTVTILLYIYLIYYSKRNISERAKVEPDKFSWHPNSIKKNK